MSRYNLICVSNADICDEVYYGGEWGKVLDRIDDDFIIRNPGPEDEPSFRVRGCDCEAARKLNIRAIQDRGVPAGETWEGHEPLTIEEVGNVDPRDYPDFCDAYIYMASWNESGQDLTEKELDILNESFRCEVNAAAHEHYH